MLRQYLHLSHMLLFLGMILLVIMLPISTVARADARNPKTIDDPKIAYLKGLSIEALLKTEITSASKKAEPLFDTASAVFVITQEDLRRTGARTIPDALRMVPGLQVAHINASTWAITSRGFADWFSNKLLVMIDGRSVYTPLFSGVYWDVQDTMIADIDRIEVIRGPGATVWGANAVNGVINIITKKASETQGGLVSVGAGTHAQPLVEARYGARIADSADVRVYAKGFQREPFETTDGDDAHDAWKSMRGGFRADWQTAAKDDVTLDGQIYDGEADLALDLSGFLTPPYSRSLTGTQTISGGHLLSRWSRQWTAASELMLQAYYDRTHRNQVVAEEKRDTLDVEFKHHWDPEGRHDVVWGLNYRWTRDDIVGTWNTSFDPDSRSDNLWSAFAQDDVMLVTDRLWLTLGSKFEHNDYSGWEIQPNARLRLKPSADHMLWAAVSRAVRTPSRSDHDFRTNLISGADELGNVSVFRIEGNEDFKAEELIAYEAGYRWQPDRRFYLDLTAFYNDYEQLRDVQNSSSPYLETAPAPPHLVVPHLITNEMQGHTYGIETLATWKPVDIWQVSASYAYIELDLHSPNTDGSLPPEAETSPKHQFQVRSYLDLPWQLHLDSELYYVDRLKALDIDGYTRIDLRLEWNPTRQWALSIGIENLLDDAHTEFDDRAGVNASEVPRIVYGQATLRF